MCHDHPTVVLLLLLLMMMIITNATISTLRTTTITATNESIKIASSASSITNTGF